VLQLGLQVFLEAGRSQLDGKLTLCPQLVNALLKALVDVLHLEVLLAGAAQVSAELVNDAIAIFDQAGEVFELLDVVGDDLFEVVLHNADLSGEKADLLLELVVLQTLVLKGAFLIQD
jgi:hypothetical protein